MLTCVSPLFDLQVLILSGVDLFGASIHSVGEGGVFLVSLCWEAAVFALMITSTMCPAVHLIAFDIAGRLTSVVC